MKTLLITGGTGFLGQKLAKELRPLFSKIILCSRSVKRNNVLDELGNEYVLEAMDITDKDQVELIFKKHKPDFVLHTAAVKSVQAAELNPLECINTNIVGSENIARAAIQYNCKKLVAMSSLRAAPPAEGVYGMSKALMEKVFCAYANKSNTKFVSIRSGNIAWSPESVLKLWKQMLEKDGRIKSTGSGMSRYFITSGEMILFIKNILFEESSYAYLTVIPVMKLVQIEHLLQLFTGKFGGAYELSNGIVHEKKSDSLIGVTEIPYTKRFNIRDSVFYGITDEKQANILSDEILLADSNQLMGDSEIMNVINSY